MPRACTVCGHSERKRIDAALIEAVSYRNIAERFSVSTTALHRHRQEHLPTTLVQAEEQDDVRHAIDVLTQLRAINGATLSVLKDAREAKDGDLALKAVDRVQRQIELQAKLIGELDDRPVGNVVASPEWLRVRGLADAEEGRAAAPSLRPACEVR